MSAVLANPELGTELPLEDQQLVAGLDELFGGGRIGHLSKFFYLNGGGDKYRHILVENDAYSPFADEPKVLADHASI